MQVEILHPASLQLVRTLLQQLYGAQKVILLSAKPIDTSDATDGPSAVVIVTIILILLTLILLMLAVIAITIRLYQHGMVFFIAFAVSFMMFL